MGDGVVAGSDAPEAPVVSVVGLVGGESFGGGAREAVWRAEVVVGSSRHLGRLAVDPGAEQVELRGPLPAVLDIVAERARSGRRVCVVASGDPGFFGIVRALRERLGPGRLQVHPAPSSVSLAFARVGMSWDDATVVSAHGRPLPEAAALATGPKVAVLTSPDNPPDAVGAAVAALGCGPRRVAVVSRIGEPGESVTHTDLAGLAARTFDPLSVVILTAPDDEPEGAGLRWAPAEDVSALQWALPEEAFEHRNGMITKSEVRAVVLARLGLPASGVLWDIGAGSGSVAIECARLRPGLRVLAIERNAEDAARIRSNAARHGARVEVIEGEAPAALESLPDPDRVFVGGGGMAVLDAALARLRPGGVVVATYALVDRAAAGWRALGNMVQLSVDRAVAVADQGVRLSAENPVFLCWGPSA